MLKNIINSLSMQKKWVACNLDIVYLRKWTQVLKASSVLGFLSVADVSSEKALHYF